MWLSIENLTIVSNKILHRVLKFIIKIYTWKINLIENINGEVLGESLGAFDEDSNHDSKIEDEKLAPRAGTEPSIIPAWEETIKH